MSGGKSPLHMSTMMLFAAAAAAAAAAGAAVVVVVADTASRLWYSGYGRPV